MKRLALFPLLALFAMPAFATQLVSIDGMIGTLQQGDPGRDGADRSPHHPFDPPRNARASDLQLEMTDYRDILYDQLPRDEGVRHMPYVDTAGKTSIGIGRNLTDVGVHDDEIEMMLDNDISAAEMAARSLLDNFDALSDVRKAVVVNMAFNLGYQKLAEFAHTLKAIRESRWDDAADGMNASLWAREVGARALRLSAMMRSDTA